MIRMEKKTYMTPVSETVELGIIGLVCVSGGGNYEEKLDVVPQSGSGSSGTPSYDSDGYMLGD